MPSNSQSLNSRCRLLKTASRYRLILRMLRLIFDRRTIFYELASGPSGVRFVDALAVLSVLILRWSSSIFGYFWKFVSRSTASTAATTLGSWWSWYGMKNTSAIFGAIMGFWFGDRMMVRGQQRMAATNAVAPSTVTQKQNKRASASLNTGWRPNLPTNWNSSKGWEWS